MPDFKIRLSTEEIITWSQSKVHTFHEPAIPVTDTAAVIIVSENFLQIACVFFSIISLMLMLLSLQFNWRVYCRCLLLLLNMLISVLIISWSWWPNLVRSTSVLHKAEILFQKIGENILNFMSLFSLDRCGWKWSMTLSIQTIRHHLFVHASFMPRLCPLMVGKKGRWWCGWVLIGKNLFGEMPWGTDEEERSQVVGFIEPLTFNLKSSFKFQLLIHNN